MKKKFIKIIAFITLLVVSIFTLTACDQADTVKHNIQKDANKFETYRKMTFVNLYTDTILYTAEGYFSVQTTYSNDYQGQQEIALVFKLGKNEFKIELFGIDTGRLGGPCRIKKGVDKPLIVVGGLGVVGLGGF